MSTDLAAPVSGNDGASFLPMSAIIPVLLQTGVYLRSTLANLDNAGESAFAG